MKKFFILLAACTVGFMNTTNAMTNESTATTTDVDIEEVFVEVAGLIDQYVDHMMGLDEAKFDESIKTMCDTLAEFDDMTLYEATMSYFFTTLNEEIPERGFSMERWGELYDEISDWKARLFEDNITEEYVGEWFTDYAIYCGKLPKDEGTYAACMMSKYLADLIESENE
ncbi:MAG: hypothetical protein IKB15_01070 [Alistipes sp.]|nr:hypothetical protein [Alistipes sp.]